MCDTLQVMKFSIFVIVFFAWPLFTFAGDLSFNPERCSANLQGEAVVYSNDFKWNLTLDEIKNLANILYKSEKRLAQRAYYDETMQSFVFPNPSERGGLIKIPAQFIKTISRHIEKAFERGYIDAVIFPDMGHSHFLIPIDFYKKDIESLSNQKINLIYERIMNNNEVKVMYHTAEQLRFLDENKKLIDDKKIQWRYFTRNLVGHNSPEPELELVDATATSLANTMSSARGYYWWGAGFNIHANEKACFKFQKNGKTMYFDLSLKDLEPSPDSDTGDL